MEHITCTLNLSLAVICEKSTIQEGGIWRNWFRWNFEIDLCELSNSDFLGHQNITGSFLVSWNCGTFWYKSHFYKILPPLIAFPMKLLLNTHVFHKRRKGRLLLLHLAAFFNLVPLNCLFFWKYDFVEEWGTFRSINLRRRDIMVVLYVA